MKQHQHCLENNSSLNHQQNKKMNLLPFYWKNKSGWILLAISISVYDPSVLTTWVEKLYINMYVPH